MFISVSIFYGMQEMINSNQEFKKIDEEPIMLNYLREQRDIKINKEDRIKPKKPIEKIEPKKIDIVKPKLDIENKEIKIEPLSIAQNINISSISSLDGAQVALNAELFDANNLQTITRVNPFYPRKAQARKKEGYVQLKFHISADGKVSDVEILEENPIGFFKDASIKAIKKWRFKPTNSAKDATIRFDYRLAK